MIAANELFSVRGRTALVTVASACAAGSATAISQVQGTVQRSPFVGQPVTVQGVVVGDYEGGTGTLSGFYLQDAGLPAADIDKILHHNAQIVLGLPH